MVMEVLEYTHEQRVKPGLLGGTGIKGSVCRAWLDDLRTDVAPLPFALRGDAAGLLVRRQGAAMSAPLRFAAVDDGAGWEFIDVARAELVRAATSMSRSALVASVVVCPPGASPARTALAVAVANLLQVGRDDGRTVVTCAVCPPIGVGRSAIPHEVDVTTDHADGPVQVRRVWEIVPWADLSDWHAALSSWPVSA
jgi:hypothetical protein